MYHYSLDMQLRIDSGTDGKRSQAMLVRKVPMLPGMTKREQKAEGRKKRNLEVMKRL